MSKLISGIYKIEDIKTGNIYVGSANAKNGIKKRWSWHLARLRKNKHYYAELQEAWNDNDERIKFEILEECCDNELEERENFYIDYCKKVGWNVINKQENAVRKRRVKDTRKMKIAQRCQKNGNSRLTEIEVREILFLKKNKVKHKKIAEVYGVSTSHIQKIGKTKWSNISEAIKPDWFEKDVG